MNIIETSLDRPPRTRQVLGLIALVALCLAVGAIGGAVTDTTVNTWYQTLRKPPFNPPNWIFAPVWTALYIAMAVAAWRVWRRHGLRGAPSAMILFAIQLALNLCWSILFFGFRQIGLALVEIGLLLAGIFATALAFWAKDRFAAYLLVPYAAWVSFATVLNAALWRLN